MDTFYLQEPGSPLAEAGLCDLLHSIFLIVLKSHLGYVNKELMLQVLDPLAATKGIPLLLMIEKCVADGPQGWAARSWLQKLVPSFPTQLSLLFLNNIKVITG